MTAKASIALAAATLLAALCGCRSHHVDATVENRTGQSVRLLEVDYPNASFGADNLPPGADFHYRFQLSGQGPIKVQYTTGEGGHSLATQITGPALAEPQQGRLLIVLLPGGKAEFHPQLSPRP